MTLHKPEITVFDQDGDELYAKRVGGFGVPMLLVAVTQDNDWCGVNLDAAQARQLAEYLFTFAAPESAAAVPEWDTLPPLEVPRDPAWRKLEQDHLEEFPYCAVCGTKQSCVGHHVIPVHVNPNKELDPDNLITLCPPDHLTFGHLKNWRSYNEHVREDCAAWKERIRNRPSPVIAHPQQEQMP